MPTGPVCSHPEERNLNCEEAPQIIDAGVDGLYNGASQGAALDAGGIAAMPNLAPAQWFALVVKPRFDKAVARTLEAKGYETLVPTYRKHHTYGTRSKVSELPLFPGYVCCRFDVRTSLPILSTPGVVHIVGVGRAPIPISDVEVRSLQAAINARLPVQPFPFVNVGQRVRITTGVLAGIEGIVLGPKPNLRLILSITLLQRSVLLEINRDQVRVETTLELTPSL